MADESIVTLTRQMMAGVERLVRDEVRLALLTAKEQGARAARGGVLVGAAAVAAAFGTACLAIAALIALSTALDRPWFAGIIVAVVLLSTALLVIAPGFRGLVIERMREVPINTADSVRRDIEAVRHAVPR
jgi:uncharacterized membrane protein YqjE